VCEVVLGVSLRDILKREERRSTIERKIVGESLRDLVVEGEDGGGFLDGPAHVSPEDVRMGSLHLEGQADHHPEVASPATSKSPKELLILRAIGIDACCCRCRCCGECVVGREKGCGGSKYQLCG